MTSGDFIELIAHYKTSPMWHERFELYFAQIAFVLYCIHRDKNDGSEMLKMSDFMFDFSGKKKHNKQSDAAMERQAMKIAATY